MSYNMSRFVRLRREERQYSVWFEYVIALGMWGSVLYRAVLFTH